jgi:hypothetical protein
MTAPWTGFLRRSADGEGIEGELCDAWGWRVTITGTRGARDGVRGYILTGILGEPPKALRVPAVDDPPASGFE